MVDVTYLCFSLANRFHIVTADNTASLCGIRPMKMPKVKVEVDAQTRSLCQSCLLHAMRQDWEVEPLGVAEGRGFEHEGSFECIPDDPA